MSKITEIDKNFSFKAKKKEENIVFYNAEEKPFDLYGIKKDSAAGKFTRMPLDVAKEVNEGVYTLCSNTSGGRIRFRTDSPYIAIKCKIPVIELSSNMAISGTTGFDLYSCENGRYTLEWVFIPDTDENQGYESIKYFTKKKIREFTLNFPLYNDVNDLLIGIEKGSLLECGDKYSDINPVLFYGSSITQGGCASRPGNAYPAILSREYNFDFINLGFSGSAFGEERIAEYIASLDISCFVMDYDHNAVDAEFLEKTHYKMYEIVRQKNPDLPIILMSMPHCVYAFEGTLQKRKEIIKQTYEKALSEGDKNIYFVDESESFNIFGGDIATTDLIHPNDLGFACMAESLKPIFNKIFR